MIFCKGFSKIPRNNFNGFLCRCLLFKKPDPHQIFVSNAYSHSLMDTTHMTIGCREFCSSGLPTFHGDSTFRHDIHHQSSLEIEEPQDPFALVSDEVSLITDRLRSVVASKVPKLASCAEYVFKMGVEGKRFRPTVILLMSTALNVGTPESPIQPEPPTGSGDDIPMERRARQQRVAEIAESIHVASLLHDNVLDDAETRHGIGSVNSVNGNKKSVLTGDFFLSRACTALDSLRNTEVVSLLSTVVEHLVTGEIMQMTAEPDQHCSMEYYIEKTYYKTASLISNSCKAVAVLAGHSTEVAMMAFDYGKNLGLAFQMIDDVLNFTGTTASLRKGSLSDICHGIITAPILFAMEEYPQLRAVVEQGFDNPANVDIALGYLGKSKGIQRTRELARRHANLAAEAIKSLPESYDEDVRRSRRALLDLTHLVIRRTN